MTTWAGNVTWAGGVRWALGEGESLPPTGWPTRGVRALAPLGGVDLDPIKVFEQLSGDREVYEVDFEAKYLVQLEDTADTLDAFTPSSALPATPAVAVGELLPSGRVMFAVGPGVPIGLHSVLVRISTTGGRLKGCVVQIRVDR